MKWEFEEHTAVVTGAGSGIGAAVVASFVAAGARVIAVDLSEEGLVHRQEELGPLGRRVVPIVADVSDSDGLRAVLGPECEAVGGIDHLVNCAASFVAAGVDATRRDWSRALEVNVAGSALLTAFVADRMPRGGTVVNISSISAHVAQRDRWTYNATKAGILALTRGQALDLAPRGIRVNAVSPGWIWTAEVAKAAQGDRAQWEPVWGRYHMLERLGEPSEVADAVLFLSSDGSTFITGTELMVDGGYRALGPEGLGETARFASSD